MEIKKAIENKIIKTPNMIKKSNAKDETKKKGLELVREK